ncbi:MAG: hypothetical protein HY536_00245 [Candidatus Colwellbacteria bacterium]|nr:hypothetical protein [Candidatus Colwellbacteria bacterium]
MKTHDDNHVPASLGRDDPREDHDEEAYGSDADFSPLLGGLSRFRGPLRRGGGEWRADEFQNDDVVETDNPDVVSLNDLAEAELRFSDDESFGEEE